MSLLLNQELWENARKEADMQHAVATWLGGGRDDFTHSVTLTFPEEPDSTSQAEDRFGRFQKYLNKECFRRPKSRDDRVKMAAVLEGARYKNRLHYHCAMRKPDKFSSQEFARRIKKAWRKTVGNGEARVDVQVYVKGWLPYMAKELSVSNTDGVSQHNDF
jgi:hypothetical protein